MTFDNFMSVETEIQELSESFESARQNGDIQAQRKLRGRVNSLNQQRQNIGNNVMSVRQYLSIINYVLLNAGEEELAQELIEEVNGALLSTPFQPLPTTAMESEQEMIRYGLIN